MILAFITHWPSHLPNAGQPTHFVEKIWNGITGHYQDGPDAFLEFYNQNHERIDTYDMNVVETAHPKLHTIRSDQNNRWHHGTNIHFAINVRTKNQWQFAPCIPCTGVDQIKITHTDPDGFKLATPLVFINGIWLPDPTQLALNDGFASLNDFFAWFSTDFSGKIIHWANQYHQYATPLKKAIHNA